MCNISPPFIICGEHLDIKCLSSVFECGSHSHTKVVTLSKVVCVHENTVVLAVDLMETGKSVIYCILF